MNAKKLAAITVVLTVLLSPVFPSSAQSSQASQPLTIAADILFLRPFSLAATVIGFAVYVACYPYFALADDGTEWENLVARPGRATFTRCLGCDLIEAREAERSGDEPG